MASVLEEKDSIRETMARYCFYTDSGQSEKYADLFTEDCDWDGGPFGRCLGKAALLAMHRGSGDSATKLRHVNTNVVITLNDNEAQATSYVAVIGVGETAPTIFFAGTYVDQFVKRGGRWLFKVRRIVPDITTIKAVL
jgi:SnoaL-like protein